MSWSSFQPGEPSRFGQRQPGLDHLLERARPALQITGPEAVPGKRYGSVKLGGKLFCDQPPDGNDCRPKPTTVSLTLAGLVRRVRRQLPLGYYRRRALQPPEAGALQPVLPVELLQRPALHLGRIGPGGSERPADLALPCIDMFPIWDTLSANKTGRCPKWPRPK